MSGLDAHRDFLGLSAALTGFEAVDLEGTGLVEAHANTVRDIVGERIFGRLLLTWHQIDEDVAESVRRKILESPLVGPVARNIIQLWYTGIWNQMPGAWRNQYGASARDLTQVVSGAAYREGLVWRVIGAHPPAAKAPGFGTWTAPPGEDPDTIADAWQTGTTGAPRTGATRRRGPVKKKAAKATTSRARSARRTGR